MKRRWPLLIALILAGLATANRGPAEYRVPGNAQLSDSYRLMGLSYAATVLGFRLEEAIAQLEPPDGFTRFTKLGATRYDLQALSLRTSFIARESGSDHRITLTWTIGETSPDRASVEVTAETNDFAVNTLALEQALLGWLDRNFPRVTRDPPAR